MLLKGDEARVVSTLDGKLQYFALETLNHYLADLKEGHVSDGSVLVVDNHPEISWPMSETAARPPPPSGWTE